EIWWSGRGGIRSPLNCVRSGPGFRYRSLVGTEPGGLEPRQRPRRRFGDGGGDRRRRRLLFAPFLGVEHDEDRDDDRQRAEYPGGPQQRALTRREGAPRRRAVLGGTRPDTGGGGADLRPGRDGGRGGPVDRRRLVGARRAAAGPHRGDGVGELTTVAVPHARVLHQRDLDQLPHVGW